MSETVLTMEVRDKTPTLVNGPHEIICDNSHYRLVLDLDEEWDSEGAITVIYNICGHGTVMHPIMGREDSIPVIATPGILKIGITAGSIRTTTDLQLRVIRSIRTGVGTEIPEPEPSIYDQIMERLNAASIGKHVSNYRIITEPADNTHTLVLVYSDGAEMEIPLPQMGIDIDRVVKIGDVDPTELTSGEKHQLYINKSNGKVWVNLTGTQSPVTWIPVSSGGGKTVADLNWVQMADSGGHEEFLLRVTYTDGTTNDIQIPTLDSQLKQIVSIGSTSPRMAQVREFWFNTTEKRLYICTAKQPPYDDPIFEPVVPETLQEDTNDDALSPGNTVMTTPQVLTEEQKTQARDNIGAASKKDLRRVVLPEQTVVAEEDEYGYHWAEIDGTFDFIMGQKYIVVFNGKEYECIANDDGGDDILLGNGGIWDDDDYFHNNEPFMIYDDDDYDGLYLYVTEPGEYTVAIYMDVLDTINSSEVVVVEQTIWPYDDDTRGGFNVYEYYITPINTLMLGKEYIVVFDGKKYKCTAYGDDYWHYLGNYEVHNSSAVEKYKAFYSDEPFFIWLYDSVEYGYVYVREMGGEHTISITKSETKSDETPWAPDIVCDASSSDNQFSFIVGDYYTVKKKCEANEPVFCLSRYNGGYYLSGATYGRFFNRISIDLPIGVSIYLYEDGRFEFYEHD